MSYQQYSGNPYAGDYGTSNPYESQNPYGNTGGYAQTPPAAQYAQQPPPPMNPVHQDSNYSAMSSNYSTGADGAGDVAQYTPQGGNVQYVQPTPTVLSNSDFLSRVEAAKADIRTLTTHVGQIASMHQKTLSAPDNSATSALEGMVSKTQVLNTSIKDQIKFLEADAARSKDNPVKNTQINQLKTSFTKQLQEYRQEEASYEKRYREQIARQYRIVNPEATDSEVQEAANADWGNEGVFQTALKTNRTAHASSVLGAVRARHNDIQKIERTMLELQQLMEDLATAVVLQEAPIQQAEQHTENVKHDTEAGNQQLDKGIEHARRARKLKWWCFWIVVLICCILALVLGLYFGLQKN